MTPTADEISRVMRALANRRKPEQRKGGRRMCACGQMSEQKARKVGHKCGEIGTKVPLTKQRT